MYLTHLVCWQISRTNGVLKSIQGMVSSYGGRGGVLSGESLSRRDCVNGFDTVGALE